MSLERKIYFVLTDLDYKIKATDDSPTLRLFGKTENETVLVLLRDFLPYFYVSEKEGLVEFLNGDLVIKRWIKKIDELTKKKYFGGEELKLLKLIGSHPEQTPIIRERLQRAGYEVHEADIPFVKRFLLDTGIRGLNVLTVTSGQISTKDKNIIIDTSYLKVTPTPKSEISSVDYFYRIKLMAFDIEIDHIDETMQQLIEMKNKRITAISYAWGTTQLDEQKKTFILKEDSDIAEREIIYAFIKDMQRIQPDVLLTFNGDNFDLPYLLSRMSHLKISNHLLSLFQEDAVFYSNRTRCYRIKGRISYDISPRTWGIHPLSGKKGLGDIAEVVLGKTKIKINRPLGVIWRSGFLNSNKKDKVKFRKYSITDSVLTYKLLWKLGVPGWLEVIRLTGYPPGEAPGSTERIQGEFELMRFAGQQGVLIPSAPTDAEVARRRIERRKNPHTGGTVLIPKGTLHLAVIISDFRSMYPSVCVSHNIGGETLKRVRDIDDSNPLELFHAKPQSCLSLMQETLIKRREETKLSIKVINQKLLKQKDNSSKRRLLEEQEILDKEQYSLKIVANSMYGAHNYIRSRFYSITLGNAITNIARTYILNMEKLLKDVSEAITPVEIVYGDTDSAFIRILDNAIVTDIYNETNPKQKVKLTSKLLTLTHKILRFLNSKFPEAMELTLEDIAYKLIFKPKRAKAYSYYSILNDKLKITGFEAVRSDWSKLSRDAQRKVLELILKEPVTKLNCDDPDEKVSSEDLGVVKAKDYLMNLSIKILKMPAEQLIPKATILAPIKKNPKEYKTKMPAVQAFLDFAQKEGLDADIAWKEYHKFPWVITPGKGLISDRARHPKYATEIDREHYIAEILRASEGFGLKITLQDVKNSLTTEPIDEILKRIPQSQQKQEDEGTQSKTKSKNKQTKISAFLEQDNN